MSKAATIDRSQLKAAIDAIKDRTRPDIHKLRLAQSAKIMRLRRDLRKNLQPVFAGAAVDAAKIDKVLLRHRTDMRTVLQETKAGLAGEFAATGKMLRQGIDNTRLASEQFAWQPYLTTPIPISTPYLIYATPIGMLHDSHTEPWNNWAKFTYTSDVNTGYASVVVNFYFAWQNPSNYLAVINCDTDVLATGVVQATADTGWILPGSSALELWAQLTVFLGSTTINWQGPQERQIASISASGGWAPISEGDLESHDVSGAYHLSCSDIQVQGNQLVVFEVACLANWWIDEGGSIVLDFDFAPGDYQVACPALNVDLLTPPQGRIRGGPGSLA